MMSSYNQELTPIVETSADQVDLSITMQNQDFFESFQGEEVPKHLGTADEKDLKETLKQVMIQSQGRGQQQKVVTETTEAQFLEAKIEYQILHTESEQNTNFENTP